MKLWHVTHKKNVASILKRGIIPMYGAEFTYYTNVRKHVNTIIKYWVGKSAAIIEVDVPDMMIKNKFKNLPVYFGPTDKDIVDEWKCRCRVGPEYITNVWVRYR